MPEQPPATRRTVQLLHELPDGSSHVDWMLARDEAGEKPLATFRLSGRVDELGPGQALAAERIGDHRPAYLTYEGPVSGGRGTVRRLCAGRIVAWEESPDLWVLQIVWEAEKAGGPRQQRLRMKRGEGPQWTVAALP